MHESRPRPRSARRLAAGAAVAAAIAASAAAGPAAAAPGEVSLLAGGPGAGPAAALGFTPTAVVAWDGRLAVSDVTGTVRAVDPATGASERIAGAGIAVGGPLAPLAVDTLLSQTHALAVTPAPARDLLVADGCGIVRVDRADRSIARVAGDCSATVQVADGAPGTSGRLDGVWGLAVEDDGTILLVDGADRVRRIDPAGVVTTLADGPDAGAEAAGLADGVPLRDAWLRGVTGIARDTATGDLLLTEGEPSHRLRRIDAGADGRIGPADPVSTVAGTGVAGYAPAQDGGPAAVAQLDGPAGVGVLADGRIVVGDRLNRRVRLIAADAQRTITTIATGADAAAAVGRPVYDGPLFRPAGAAQLGDAVYVVDGHARGLFNGSFHQLLRIDLGGATPAVTRAAGNGSRSFSGDDVPGRAAQLHGPTSLATAPDGATLVADTANNRVRRVDPATGRVTTLAGSGRACGDPGYCGEGGPAAAAGLSGPTALAAASDGTVYWADGNDDYEGTWLSRIMKRTPGGTLEAVTGPLDDYADPGYADGPLADARFGGIAALALAPGERTLYVADGGNAVVRAVDLDRGVVTTIAGTLHASEWVDGDEGRAALDVQIGPAGLAVLPDGDLLIADEPNHAVRRLDLAADRVTTVLGNGVDPGDLADPEAFRWEEDGELLPPLEAPILHPRALAVRADGAIAVAAGAKLWLHEPDEGVRRVHGLQQAVGFRGDDGPALERPLAHAGGVTFAADGALLVTDTLSNRLRRVEPPAAPGPGPGPGPGEPDPGPGPGDPGPGDPGPGPGGPGPSPGGPGSPPGGALPPGGGERPVARGPRIAALRAPRTVRLTALRRGVAVTVRATTRGRATAELRVDRALARRLGLPLRGRAATAAVAGGTVTRAGGTARLVLRATPRTRAALGRVLLAHRAAATLRVTVTGAGRSTTVERRLWLR